MNQFPRHALQLAVVAMAAGLTAIAHAEGLAGPVQADTVQADKTSGEPAAQADDSKTGAAATASGRQTEFDSR